MAEVRISPIKSEVLDVKIRGTTSYIAHNWSKKNIILMRDKHKGKKTKERGERDPEQEAKDAAYYTSGGVHGLPAMAFKKALITAAHKDIGIEKTLVCKAVFIVCDDPGLVVPITFKEMIVREDTVRVGQGAADLRYRPEYRNWSAVFALEIDLELLKPGDLFTLINRAGFGVGIGEMRPEKKGEYGRFEIDPSMLTNGKK